MPPLIVANWKCNPQSQSEAKNLFDSVKQGIKNIKDAEVVICPPFVYLPAVASGEGGFVFGAQDCFWEQKGAYTGEISAAMLKDLDAKYVIIGHSERRKHFGETDEIINKKIKAALSAGLKVIFCVGETEEERNNGEAEKIVKRQLSEGLKEISNFKVSRSRRGSSTVSPSGQISNLVVAYEPVWAIGTGNPCGIEDAKAAKSIIADTLSEIYSRDLSRETPVLYGGSVNSKNAAGYIKEAGFNGLLVGGASLDPEDFCRIIRSAE